MHRNFRLVFSVILIWASLIFTFTACNENSTDPNPDDFNNGIDYREMYKDSILFLSNRFSDDASTYHILIMNCDGSAKRELFGKWNIQQVSWSLRTGRIFFVTDTASFHQTYQIGVCDIKGRNERIIYSSEYLISSIRISPDGNLLAMIVNNGNENKLQILDCGDFSIRDLGGWQTREMGNVCWSPDGRTLGVPMLDSYGSPQSVHFATISLDALHFKYGNKYFDMVSDYNRLDWCLANNKIVVNVNHYGFAVTYILDYITKEDEIIYGGVWWVLGMSWSQDGSKIAFSVNEWQSMHSYIFLLNGDGTNYVRLTDGEFDDRLPCWQ
ncbi:MAG: hypothetical protein A2V66_12160 [Ignavibacteria bacterium RBG_13_36_8]|nr:MAG: hypothetical protein A2V66_12160 [Ignavibacteria bacterium RBG_13_36_8]